MSNCNIFYCYFIAIFSKLLYDYICIKLGENQKNGGYIDEKILILFCSNIMLIMLIAMPIYATSNVPANNAGQENNNSTQIATEKNVLETENATKFAQMKEEFKSKFEQYSEKYGSDVYGVVALILDTLRIYSIPFCFVGIAVGAIYQYVIGIRKLDVRDRGFNLVIAFVTALVICQVLPLVFAVVTRGWVL